MQNIHRFGGCLRINYVNSDFKMHTNIGGCAQIRNSQSEKKSFDLLVKKWGSDIVTIDKASKKTFDFNPILRIPLKGI